MLDLQPGQRLRTPASAFAIGCLLITKDFILKPLFQRLSWPIADSPALRGVGLILGLMALSPIPESQAASAIVAIRDDGGRVNLAWSYGASKPGDAVATAMSTCRSTLQYNKAKGSCEMVAHYDGPGFIAIVLARAEDDQRFGYAFSGDRQDAIKQAYVRCIAFGEVDCQEEAGHVFWDGGPAGLSEPGVTSRAVHIEQPATAAGDRKKAYQHAGHKSAPDTRTRASTRL
jgi:hypothetical protein